MGERGFRRIEIAMIHVFKDRCALARRVAGFVLEVGRRCVAERGVFRLVLSGGGTPETTYRMLGETAETDRAVWQQTHFYWGDERCVPPDDPQSNYLTAKRALFDQLHVSPDRVHRIEAEAPDPDDAARRYAKDFPAHPDLALLGVGTDGHMASIFPRSRALHEEGSFCAVEAPVDPRCRITMTPRTILAAGEVLVLVSGSGKADALLRVFGEQGSVRDTPARLLRDATWLVDEAAAGPLTSSRTARHDGTVLET